MFCCVQPVAWAQYYHPVAEPLHVVPSVEKKEGPQVEAIYDYDHRKEDEPWRVAGFLVTPEVSLDALYLDNIFAQESGEEDDVITKISPEISVKKEGKHYTFAAQVRAQIGRFQENSGEDYEDFGATVRGRYDVRRHTSVQANFSVDRLHEDRASPDDQNGITPTLFTQTEGILGFEHKPGRVRVLGEVSAKRLDYKNVRTSTGSVIDNNRRDRTHKKARLRVGYQVNQTYEAFAEVSRLQIRYDTLDNGQDRDAISQEMRLGTALELTGKVRGEAFVGYLSHDVEEAGLSDIVTPTMGGNLLWNINQLTSVQAQMQRRMEETLLAGASGYVATHGSLRVEHELRRHALLFAQTGYTHSRYKSAAPRREDDLWNVGFGGVYRLGRALSLALEYGYEDLSSTVAGQGYARNRVLLRLTGKLG